MSEERFRLPDPTFMDVSFRAREAEGPMRVEAAVSDTKPGADGDGIVPHVVIWYDTPPPMGGGFTILSIAQARRLADLLVKCAEHAQRAKDEAERRGWRLLE